MNCKITIDTLSNMPSNESPLLREALCMAVPLWVEQFVCKPYSELQEMIEPIANTLAHKGDIILFKSKVPGETAAAFNDLAKGIAIMSFIPGGVPAFGHRFESKHPDIIYSKAAPTVLPEED